MATVVREEEESSIWIRSNYNEYEPYYGCEAVMGTSIYENGHDVDSCFLNNQEVNNAGTGGGTTTGEGDKDSSSNNNNNEKEDVEDQDKVFSPEEQRKLAMERSKAVAWDFVLNYPKWAMSLFLFFTSLRIPPIDNIQDAAQLPFQHLKTFVREETDAYYMCTLDTFERLEQEIVDTANRENDDNVRVNQDYNLQLLQTIENTTNACTRDVRQAQRGLFLWNTKLDQPLPFLNNASSTTNSTSPSPNTNASTNSCSARDQSYIAASLGQDFQELENEVSTIFTDYRDTNENSLARIRDYAQDRSDYDYNFFVRDRLEPALVLLETLGNNAFDSVKFSVNNSYVVQLLDMVEVYADNLNKALGYIFQLNKRLQLFYDNINHWHDNYSLLLNRAFKMINATNPWLCTDCIDISVFAKLPRIDPTPFQINYTGFDILNVIPDSLYPPNFQLVQMDEFPDLNMLLENFEKDATKLITDLLEELEQQAEAHVRALELETKETLDQIRQLLTLDDYDPPQYHGSRPEIKTFDAEALYLSQIGDTAQANTKEALDRAQGLTNTTTSAEIPSDIPEIDPVDHSFAEETTTFDYRDISVPGFLSSFMELFEAFISFVISRNLWFEFGVNLVRLLLLKRKHERNAGADLPKISIGTMDSDRNGDSEGLWERLKSFAWFVLLRLFNPWIISMLIFIPVSIFVIQSWVPHVHESCVQSNNGTSIARTISIPYVINQASSPGNALHVEREFDCFRRQRLVCDKQLGDSEVAYGNALATLSHLQQRYNRSVEYSSRLERCIDTEALDLDFVDACCGLEGYGTECSLEPQMRANRCPIDDSASPAAAVFPIGYYLSEPHCRADTSHWELKDSRFDCESIQDICSKSQCTGVDEDLIRSMVIEADCQANFTFIRAALFFIVALYHGAMMNLTLPLVLTAYRCLHYSGKAGIKFTTQIDEDGKILKGADQEERTKKAEAAMRRFRFKGRWHLVCAVLCLITWVFVAVVYLPEAPTFHR